MLVNLEDLQKQEYVDLLHTLTTSLANRIVIVFSLKTEKIVNIFLLKHFTENNPNNKYFKIKGQEITPIIDKVLHSNTLIPETAMAEINLQIQYSKQKNIQYSENAFGYILYDISSAF